MRGAIPVEIAWRREPIHGATRAATLARRGKLPQNVDCGGDEQPVHQPDSVRQRVYLRTSLRCRASEHREHQQTQREDNPANEDDVDSAVQPLLPGPRPVPRPAMSKPQPTRPRLTTTATATWNMRKYSQVVSQSKRSETATPRVSPVRSEYAVASNTTSPATANPKIGDDRRKSAANHRQIGRNDRESVHRE